MDKWFKLAKEWYEYEHLTWDPKGNWKLFVNKIKEVWNVERIGWNLLDFEETRKRLLSNKVKFESCFELKEHKL